MRVAVGDRLVIEATISEILTGPRGLSNLMATTADHPGWCVGATTGTKVCSFLADAVVEHLHRES
jgi:hypothetical protein